MRINIASKRKDWFTGGFIAFAILSLIAGILSISGVKRISKKFHELFVSNLVPAMDISRAIELKFQNRVYLEEYLTGLSGENVEIVERRIARNNKRIDTIIEKYVTSSSLLQPDEEADLKNFMKAHQKYRRSEAKVIALTKKGNLAEAELLFKSENYQLFMECIKPMERFEQDDLKHSQNLYREVTQLTKSIVLMLYVAMGVGAIIAVIIFIGWSRVYMEH